MNRLPARAEDHASALAVSAVLSALVAFAALGEDTGFEPAFDHDMYAGMMATGVSDPGDLIDDYELQQFEYLFIAPPAAEPWIQGGGIRPFDPEGFPDDFVSGLVPVVQDGVTNYPVYVVEDPDTRERVFANANLEEIGAVDPPEDYAPTWFVDCRYPDLHERGWDEEYIEFITQCYDPSRVIIRYRLMTEAEVIKYVWRASIGAALSALTEGGGMAMVSWEGGSVTNIQFVDIEAVSNGVMVTIAYPEGFTNELAIFTCPDLLGFWFDWAATTNVSATTNWIQWLDTDATNAGARFYAAGNATSNGVTDPDSDALLWAWEQYVYHTCPTNSDTDGDGLSDYAEVIELDTDPNNDDTNKPAVQIIFPPNGYRWVWVP